MSTSKKIKTILLASVYGLHLFFALALWLCGQSGNIMLGIFLIIFYRLSLWLTPLTVTVICWLPLRPRVPVRRKLLFYLVHLLFCGGLFLLCNLLFGNWY
ncbi:MAG: hypothetical protein E7605_09140 [Ruminococcaceae bacterium]|nr:hypothetical protein [Oscillospiraceae bacterium]